MSNRDTATRSNDKRGRRKSLEADFEQRVAALCEQADEVERLAGRLERDVPAAWIADKISETACKLNSLQSRLRTHAPPAGDHSLDDLEKLQHDRFPLHDMDPLC
jgi:hypothetical protein